MKLYAASRARRSRQVAGDLAMLAWIVCWSVVGVIIRHLLAALARPVDTTAAAAASYSATMTNAAGTLSGIPGVGGPLSTVFLDAAQPAATANAAATDASNSISRLALALGLLVAVGPILGAGIPWLWRRITFARGAAASQQLIAAGAGLDLLALRALSRQPVPLLAQISPDPYEAWRHGDEQVIRELAALELAQMMPPEVT